MRRAEVSQNIHSLGMLPARACSTVMTHMPGITCSAICKSIEILYTEGAVRYLAIKLDFVHGDASQAEIVAWERLLGHGRPVLSVPAPYNFLQNGENNQPGSVKPKHDL